MASDLLRREENFRKLNEELELKTKALLQEVSSVMKIHEKNKLPNKEPTQIKKNSDKKVNTENLTEALGKITYTDEDLKDVIPECSNGMGSQGLIRFLKAKVKKLQEELILLNDEYKKKDAVTKKIQSEYKTLEEKYNKINFQVDNYKEQTSKCEDQIKCLTTKLQAKDIECIGFKKEVEVLKRDLKNATSSTSNTDIKYNRALEEIEKLKTIVQKSKHDEKELRDNSRKQINEMESNIKRLEKQKSELIVGFNKQMLLIENLRKQKMHLEATKLMQINEEDFLKILEWDITEKIPLKK